MNSSGETLIKALKEKNITLIEVKKILEEKSKKEELTIMEQTTLEYVRKFSKLEYEEAVKLMEELRKFGISEFGAIQIVNILPTTVEELRTILMKEETELTPEALKEIVKLIKGYKEE